MRMRNCSRLRGRNCFAEDNPCDAGLEKNRLGAATSAVRPRIAAHITWLEQDLNALTKACDRCPAESGVAGEGRPPAHRSRRG